MLAVDLWQTILGLGPGPALALYDLELTPEETFGLRLRLLRCAELWPDPRGIG